MNELTDAEIDAALAREAAAVTPATRASAARFDTASRRTVIELANGALFAFPPELAEGLRNASDEALGDIEILDDGTGLHWEKLDVDFTVAGLVSGIFGTRRWMAQRAGEARSDAKARAARLNGSKGGRPKKVAHGGRQP
ncbi:Protein of unknown function [Rhizobium sp. RU20A]|uniref:DUF2442 domain-containing protein n=1 Tax=Rhizobium sp. RU20A TaxID=1907412 RepID=UPI0009552749|nr:DUF2442 domain-containing protein [Rhizobium sp. RU20A]SIR07313.1 Protein of unknown function [Rhizobium sp. RU20A]